MQGSLNNFEALKIIPFKHFNCVPISYIGTVKQKVHVVLILFTGTRDSVTPIGTLSDKQISLIADQINEVNLGKIAIQYFDFSFSELTAITKLREQNQSDSWLTKCRIIETWRDKDPAEHHAAASKIIYKNTGFQFLPSIKLFKRKSSLKIYVTQHFVNILPLSISEIGILTVQSG